ncbi:lipopolysaccharide transport periplasmic protein LptA [Marinobacter sp. TBZ242]|uniref:Lipopolysaccharide export system protein LptA n=1 Tax=Marinobacter azerbaijanicus TaxID=3050455 RepID=A0ABT7ID26_9GAMM|nr:lipopolysaccharide transport periplasmic protein LptA [Marinobacter sp. TBZ242]MDL0432049.1 lipopolysaccharide transport periplasmic protein LptA [Marinobacter sp. TBZ242]
MRLANKFLPHSKRHAAARSSLILAVVFLALGAPAALAFDLESDEPIRVNADSARLDDRQGVATYTGSVKMSQGDANLTADKVVLYRDENGVSRIEATGQPARYRQPAMEGQGETDARALTITWSAADNRVTFEREAIIEQDGNLFRGDVIHYDSAERVVTAEGSADQGDGGGRVEMVIQPRKSSNTTPDGQDTDGSSQGQ